MTYKSVILPEEQRTLRLFCEVTDRLTKTRFFKTYPTMEHKMRWENDGSPEGRFEYTEYDADDLHAFFVFFRRLVADKEPSHLYRVLGLVGKYGRPETREALRLIKKDFQGLEASTGGAKLLVGPPGQQREFSPSAVRDLYFNAGLFHDDETLEADRALIRDFEPPALLVLVRYTMATTVLSVRLADSIRNGGFLEPNAQPDPGESSP